MYKLVLCVSNKEFIITITLHSLIALARLEQLNRLHSRDLLYKF